MIFTPLPLAGAFRIEPQRAADERGYFARLWCKEEFAARGLTTSFVQSSISYNRHRGTLRGLHYQLPPHAETKLVRCIRGAAFDVIVDLRPASATCGGHYACELTAENQLALYVPAGFAHGFQTLADDTELLYEISEPYAPDFARGIRWNDESLAIRWPLDDLIVSSRDRSLPNFAGELALA